MEDGILAHKYVSTKGKAFNQIYTIYILESPGSYKSKQRNSKKEEVVAKRGKNQEEGIRPGNLFINNLKIAFSVAELGWDVGQKLDWEASENKW